MSSIDVKKSFIEPLLFQLNKDTREDVQEQAGQILLFDNIDTFKKVIYVYGIAQSEDEKDEIVKEAKEILDVKDVITSILLVEDLRIKKD